MLKRMSPFWCMANVAGLEKRLASSWLLRHAATKSFGIGACARLWNSELPAFHLSSLILFIFMGSHMPGAALCWVMDTMCSPSPSPVKMGILPHMAFGLLVLSALCAMFESQPTQKKRGLRRSDLSVGCVAWLRPHKILFHSGCPIVVKTALQWMPLRICWAEPICCNLRT